MSRADRIAARLAERELDLLLVTDRTNLRYLTGLHRHQRHGRGRRRRAPLRDRLPLRRAGRPAGARLRPRAGPAGLRHGARGRAGRPASCGSASRTPTCPSAHARPRPRGAARPDRARAGAAASWRPSGPSRTTASWNGSAAPRRLLDDIYDWLREWGIVGRTEREVGAGARARDAPARRQRPELPVDRRLGPARRAPARRPHRRADRRATRWSRWTSARCWTATARTARARGRRGSCPASCARPTSWCCARSSAAVDAVRPGPDGPRDRRGGARR